MCAHLFVLRTIAVVDISFLFPTWHPSSSLSRQCSLNRVMSKSWGNAWSQQTCPVLKELCRHFKIVHSNKRKTELVQILVGLAETSSAASAPPHVALVASAKTVEITAELKALPTYDSVSCWVHDFLVKNFSKEDNKHVPRGIEGQILVWPSAQQLQVTERL